MLRKLLDNKTGVLLFIFLVGLLAAVRIFENELFYDPFLGFFKSEYTNLPLPEFNPLYLFAGLFFRYLLNALISLALVYVVFKDFDLVKFAGLLYLVFFFLLTVVFFAILYFIGESNNLLLFYVRRFLIQPIFVVLFLPAFYYQARMHKK